MIGYAIAGWLLLGVVGIIMFLVHRYFTAYFVTIKICDLYMIMSGPLLFLVVFFIILSDISDKTIIRFNGRKK